MKNDLGFTLIEVLIALVILSIALTTIIKSTSQNIKDTLYLKNKTIALWVGTSKMNEARANLLKLPLAPEKLQDEIEMLGQKWQWSANRVATPNPHIEEVNVDVYSVQSTQQFVHLVSYLYVNQK